MQAPNNIKANLQAQREYHQCKNDYKQIVKTITNMEDIKKENLVVLNQIKDLEPERRCFRLIGGVLCERTIAEATKGIRAHLDTRINPSLVNLKEKMEQKEKQMLGLETRLGYASKKEAAKPEEQEKPADKSVGLLA